MPKTTRKKRWEHPTLRHAYCIERYGNVYTTICGENAQVIKGLKWHPHNKSIALNILAERFYKRAEADCGLSLRPQKEKTIYEVYQEFEEYHFKNLSRRSTLSYNSAVEKYLPNDLPITNIKAIRDMIVKQQNTLEHSRFTQSKQLSRLKVFFDFCIAQDYISKNPITKIMMPDLPKFDTMSFTREETNLLIDYFITFATPKSYLNNATNVRRIRSAESLVQYAELIEFISYIGTRISETLAIYWDTGDAPPIYGNKNERRTSVIKDNCIVIDGKRNRNWIPKIREFPLDLVPNSYEILEKCKKYKEKNNNKLFSWNSYSRIEYNIRKALVELKLETGRNLHSLRTTAINYWENELGIPPHICAYMAGHTTDIRAKHYRIEPTAENLVNMMSLANEKSK